MQEFVEIPDGDRWNSFSLSCLKEASAQKKHCFVVHIVTADWCGACQTAKPLLQHLPTLWKQSLPTQNFSSTAHVEFVWTNGSNLMKNRLLRSFLDESGVKAFPSLQLRTLSESGHGIRADERQPLTALSLAMLVEQWLHTTKQELAIESPVTVKQRVIETLLYELRARIRSALLQTASTSKIPAADTKLETIRKRQALAAEFLSWTSKRKLALNLASPEFERQLLNLYELDREALKIKLMQLLALPENSAAPSLEGMFRLLALKAGGPKLLPALVQLFEDGYRFAWRNC